jgi:hypothetical protein
MALARRKPLFVAHPAIVRPPSSAPETRAAADKMEAALQDHAAEAEGRWDKTFRPPHWLPQLRGSNSANDPCQRLARRPSSAIVKRQSRAERDCLPNQRPRRQRRRPCSCTSQTALDPQEDTAGLCANCEPITLTLNHLWQFDDQAVSLVDFRLSRAYQNHQNTLPISMVLRS